MTINFNQIPSDRLVPFVYVEFDNSRAVQGPGTKSYKVAIIGQRLSSGTIAEATPKLISSVSQAEEYFGKGSQIADMIRAYKDNDENTELWACALDDGGITKASGSFVFSGTATRAGEVAAYIAGYRVAVAVEEGDTAADVAGALRTKLAEPEYEHFPVTITGSSATVNVIAKNGGAKGNEMDIRLNYYDGEALPEGITCSVTQPASGASAPDLADAIAALGSEQFDVFIHPYTDSNNLTAMEDELEDRWGPLTQNDGVAITANNDVYADLITMGDARNSPHQMIVGLYSSPTPPWRIAAAVGANVAFYGQIDPARPFQTLELKGCLSPAITNRFTASERQLLLKSGIATCMVDSAGDLRIERLVMTYKENPFGAQDISYRDVNTLLTLSYIRWDFRNYILRRYPRHKLADDGFQYSAGQAIVTPSIMKAECILKFTEWLELGLVEGLEQFKNDLVVERNVSDPNRMDILLPVDLVNQLRVVGTQIQFLL